MTKISRTPLKYFVKAIFTKEFCAHFNIGRLRVKQFFKWIMFSSTIPTKMIAEVLRNEKKAR